MNHKIFLVDDDDSIRHLLTSLLESEGYSIIACESAAKAKKLIFENSYAAIVVDIFLPDLNGIEFIREIQDTGIVAPIIIITGSSELNHAREAVRLKVFEYLVKPFKTHQFVQIIKTAILHYELELQKKEIEEQKRKYQQELERLVDQKVAALRVSEDKYRSLVEQSLVGVYLIQDNVFQYVNKKLCEILACNANTIINQSHMADFATEGDKQLVRDTFDSLLEGRQSTVNFEFQARTFDDRNLILQVWGATYNHEGKTALEGIMIDVTEQHNAREKEKQYELELLNEHKLAAIGQLAAGIAHNLNTPISIVQGNAELLRLKYPENGDEIEKILRQTKKMSDLINSVLNKGIKEQDMSVGEVDLNDLLTEELEFLMADLYYKHHIEKDINLDPEIPKIKGIYSDFSQSIMAFIQNAIDAMYKTPVRKLTIQSSADDAYVILNIIDTGCGMDESTKQRLFEPFFTTKMKEKRPGAENGIPRGTGLGLSTAYNILIKYNVKIDFTSEPDNGTRFVLKFPYLQNNKTS